MRRLLPAAVLPFVFFACKGNPTVDPSNFPDASVEDAGRQESAKLTVVTTVIDGLGNEAPTVGDNALLALTDDGRASIAYGSIPMTSTKYEVWYAERDSDGTWTKERVVIVSHMEPRATGTIVGLGLAHVGGVPHVVYLGGDGDFPPGSPQDLTPYPTDLALSTKQNGVWTEQLLVDRSNEAPCVCPGTQDTCNFGNVVGVHAAIAATPDKQSYTIVYRDQHGGFARDDLVAKADVETYGAGSAGTSHGCVDPVRSGGEYANITHTMSGRPVVAYNLISQTGSTIPRTGVWAAAFNGTDWTLKRVSEARAASKIAIATQQSGRIWIVFNHSDNVSLVTVYSDDDGATWSNQETIDDDGKTGLHPGMTVDNLDRPVVVYGYCGRRSDSECPNMLIGRSSVKMARLEDGAWKTYDVDDGQGFGHVGFFNSVINMPDNKLGIAFVNDMNGDLVFAKEQ